MQLHEIENMERRVRSYWYADGLAELAGGGVFVLLGLFFAGQDWFPSGSLAQVLFGSSLVLVMLGGSLVTRWVVNTMKARFTYPRTGYVSYRVDQKHVNRRRSVAAVFAAIFAALLVILAARVGTTDWVPGLSGILVGALLLYMRSKVGGLRRFYYLAGFSAVLGILLSFGSLALGYRLALYYGVMGIAFALSGALSLRRYLHENPLPPEAASER